MAHSHDHSVCIDNAVEEAERICAERGSRFTELRKRILMMIWQEHKAVKAYDLLDQLATEGGSAKPPTVYRALDFLMDEGLVHKIQSLNAYIGCPHPGEDHISQFLICDNCEIVEEVSSSALSKAVHNAATGQAFNIKRQTVELHGVCSKCTQEQQVA